jgi:hypothetical protein
MPKYCNFFLLPGHRLMDSLKNQLNCISPRSSSWRTAAPKTVSSNNHQLFRTQQCSYGNSFAAFHPLAASLHMQYLHYFTHPRALLRVLNP